MRIDHNGDLEVIGNIDEGFYCFDVVAVDNSPNSSTVPLKAVAKVIAFIILTKNARLNVQCTSYDIRIVCICDVDLYTIIHTYF